MKKLTARIKLTLDSVCYLDGNSRQLSLDETRVFSKRSDTSSIDLHILSKHSNPCVRRHVAANPATPEETLVELSSDIYPYVRYGVAKNTVAPAQALNILSNDSQYPILFLVARSTSLSSDVLLMLSKSGHSSVRSAVASNANTLPTTLEQLAKDSDKSVRKEVARNTNSPQDILSYLSKDVDVEVVSMLCRNTNTLPETITMLFNLNSSYLHNQLATYLVVPSHLLKSFIHHAEDEVRASTAKHQNLTLEQQRALAQDECKRVRQNLAANETCSIITLNMLADDSDHYVCAEVVKNKNVTNDLLIKSSKNLSPAVSKALLDIETLPDEVFFNLLQTPSTDVKKKIVAHEQVGQEILEHVLYSPSCSTYVMHAASLNVSCPEDILERLAESDNDHVRNGVAKNARTPGWVIENLRYDENAYVKNTASRNCIEDCYIPSKYEHLA
jgi:hypothetical protein